MEVTIEDLLFNPTGFTIADVRELISSCTFTREQVASVMKSDVLRRVCLSSSSKPSLQRVGNIAIPDESNMVVVWGERNAGKTSLVGSILSLEGFKIIDESRFPEHKRYERLTSVFGKKGWQEMPDASKDSPIETINAVYKPQVFKRTYPISFVEVNLTKKEGDEFVWDESFENNDYLRSSLEKCAGHIHLFCLNCNHKADETLQESLDRQVGYFETVLTHLTSLGFMDTASAVYLVVTKADVLNAPKTYRDNAAQTLVTSSLSLFWQKIRNICYEKDIFDAQPLTCSVGDFALKDLAYITQDYTKRLFYKSILKKCYPRKLLVERWLNYGKWWIKWIVLPLVALFFLWFCYHKCITIPESPTSAVVPFDYGSYFQTELKVFHKAQYDNVRTHYERLHNDLLTERALLSDSGRVILSDSIGRACDSLLTKAFAPILEQGLSEFFNMRTWSKQTQKITNLKYDLNLIKGNKYLSSKHDVLFNARQKNLNDLPAVKGYIDRSKNSKSLNDIEYIEENNSKWRSYPFINDTQLNQELSNAVRNASKSCTDHYCQRADMYLTRYNNEIKSIPYKHFKSDYDKNMAIYNAKMKLKQETSSLIRDINNLMANIDYVDLKSNLSAKKKKITDITDNAKKPKKSFWDIF